MAETAKREEGNSRTRAMLKQQNTKTARLYSSRNGQDNLGNFASLRNCCGSFAENCRDLSTFADTLISPCKMTNKNKCRDLGKDDEPAQELRRRISKSRLVKFPNLKSSRHIGLLLCLQPRQSVERARSQNAKTLKRQNGNRPKRTGQSS